jgi:uncharacterized membrane protein
MQDHSAKGKTDTGSGGSREWYQKPIGILVLAVAGGILVWLVTSTLQHVFAPAQPAVKVIQSPAKEQVEPQQQPRASQPQQPKRQDAAERKEKEREKPKPGVEEDPK